MIVVDSSVWIARMRGARTDAPRKLDLIEDGPVDEICVGDVILLEIENGQLNIRIFLRPRRRHNILFPLVFDRTRTHHPDDLARPSCGWRVCGRRGCTAATCGWTGR